MPLHVRRQQQLSCFWKGVDARKRKEIRVVLAAEQRDVDCEAGRDVGPLGS
jgi:hypothetical protein